MSWPTWSAAAAPIPTAVAASVQSTLMPTGINSAPTVIAPMGYSQEQWAQAQQQNWQQWAQWQQQYQQWHQQYGAEYQKSMSTMQPALPTAVQMQPPLPTLSAAVAPPLPIENKPPLPPEEPPMQQQPQANLSAYSSVPTGYSTSIPSLMTQPMQLSHQMPMAQPGLQSLYQVQPTQNWQTAAQKRPYTQETDYNDPAKRAMLQKPPQNQWQGTTSNYAQPPPLAQLPPQAQLLPQSQLPPQAQPPPQAQAPPQTQPPPQAQAQPAKANVEELSEAEKKFDKEFAAWEAQFNRWKDQNANHPDKTQYKEYEKKWESWRNSLLERREQMRRKRIALCGQAASPAPQKPFSQPPQEVPSNNPVVSQPLLATKPSLLGAYPGDSSVPSPIDAFNKPPPNQNNEPLTFKAKTSHKEMDNAPHSGEGGGFLTSGSSLGGIPGLDLVKDDNKEDLPDRSHVVEKVDIDVIEEKPEPAKGPDFEAISKGINTILGDQKLLSMLSMVSQNAPPGIPGKNVTTDSISNMPSNFGQNFGIPPPHFQQQPPNNFNAPPPMFEGQYNQNINKPNRDDYYQQNMNPLNRPDMNPLNRPDMNPLNRPDMNPINRPDMNPLNRPDMNPMNRQDMNPLSRPDMNPLNRANARFGGPPPDIRNNVGTGSRNAPFGGRGGPGDNLSRDSGNFERGEDKFNRIDQFNDNFRGNRNDSSFRNDRFDDQDNFNGGNFNRQGNNFNNRDNFGGQYGRSDSFNPINDADDDYDYNDEEDFDKYNEMFKDEDDDHYQDNGYQKQHNQGRPLMGQQHQQSRNQDRPSMSHQDRPLMGHQDRPLMGHQDRPLMGHQDRPLMGLQDRPLMGNQDRPLMGLQDRPLISQHDRPLLGQQDRPLLGQQGRPLMSQPQPQAKIPSLMDLTPAPPQIQPIEILPTLEGEEEEEEEEEALFEPTVVIDYEHQSKAKTEEIITVVPIHMFDYNHTAVNNIPIPERPKWLAESIKFIREFDPSVLRYERPPAPTSIDSRYSGPTRDDDKYGRFEERERKRGASRRERSFERDDFHRVDRADRADRDRESRDKYRSNEREDFRKDNFGHRQIDRFGKDSREEHGQRNRKSTKDFEELSDAEMDFEQNEQARHLQKLETRKSRSRSPELSNPPNPSAKQIEITMIEDIINPPGRFNRPPRIVIILRGPPGSGKTFLARQIKEKEVEHGGSAPRILSLDDYFLIEREKKVVEDGKTVTVKEMVYEYEAEMEESYRQSFMKSFKKTVTDGYFPFFIVDNVNDKVKHFGELWSYAKQNGFQVYICQMDLDPVLCTKRNIHNRSEAEIEEIISGWEPTPAHHPTIDASGLLQMCAIADVEMELEEQQKETVVEEKEEPKVPEPSSMESTNPSENREPWKNTSKWTPSGNPRNQYNRGRRGFGGPTWRSRGTWRR